MVAKATRLSKLHVKTAFSTVLGRKPPGDNDVATVFDAGFLLLLDLFEQLKFLLPEQRTLLISETAQLLNRLDGEELLQIVFIDGRFCTWTGKMGFLGLISGENVETLPMPPLETIGYNLRELIRRNILQIENRNGLNVETNDAGNMDESEDICVSATDPVSRQVRDGGADMGPGDNNAGN